MAPPLVGAPDPETRGVLLHFWRVAGVRVRDVVIPFVLAVLVSAAEGASFSLLIPLSDGVAAGSFAGIESSRAFGWVPSLLPPDLLASPDRDLAVALVLLALLFAGRFLKIVFEYGRVWFLSGRNERYQALVRENAFGRLMGFGQRYFEDQALGHVDTELSWAATPVELLAAAEGVAMAGLRLAVKIGLVFAISPPLFASLIGSLLLLQFFDRTLSARAGALAEEGARIQKKIRREVLDLLGATQLVKAHGDEERARGTYRAMLREAVEVDVERRRLVYLKHRLDEMIVLLGALFTEALILLFVPGGPALHLARFCAFFVVAQQCLPDLNGISGHRLKITDDAPRLRALARLFRDEGKHIVGAGTRPFPGVVRALEIRDLRFHYTPGSEVLRGVNATIPAGRITALVGESGSGKTTLVDLISRLYDTAPGTILVDGVDIREFDLKSLHRRVVLVSQEVGLLNRTLRENLTFGLDEIPPDEALWRALDEVALRELFEASPDRLDTELGDRGVRLSGGQKQRVALARTLIRDPDVLILDEATAALDSVLERQVVRAVERRFRERTLIVIAHRLSTVRNADLILVMESGRIVEAGSWEELAAAGPTFRALQEAQLGRAFSPDEVFVAGSGPRHSA